jgi:hypothetical protein
VIERRRFMLWALKAIAVRKKEGKNGTEAGSGIRVSRLEFIRKK